MSQVQWEQALSRIDAALLAVDGTDLEIGRSIRERLALLGEAYSARYSPAVEAAKRRSEALTLEARRTWEATARDAFEDSDKVARAVEAAFPPTVPLSNPATGESLTFADPGWSFAAANEAAILARIDRAIGLAASAGDASSGQILAAYRVKIESTWSARPTTDVLVGPWDAVAWRSCAPSPFPGQGDLYRSEAVPPPVLGYPSTRALEAALEEQLQLAGTWADAVDPPP